jgi:hypothetical protein
VEKKNTNFVQPSHFSRSSHSRSCNNPRHYAGQARSGRSTCIRATIFDEACPHKSWSGVAPMRTKQSRSRSYFGKCSDTFIPLGECLRLHRHDSPPCNASPWLKEQWCIPKVNAEYVLRMEDLLDLYNEPYDPKRPVVCNDTAPISIGGRSQTTVTQG